ncbi:unnamed protein product [Mytilus edulis]|uniref:Reverse transcriptase RNase H-like domain-containing protein n=1 Tax=Mytilus edulis TaxID=6550 RepID=A0A8S3PY37_MYTED|nr:unnamed protein product [Mytilus edulis]
MQAAMGSVVRLRTRSLYECIMQKASWDSPVLIKEMAFDEVVFWKENVEFLNGKELLDEKVCTSVVYTDASGTGFGGYIVEYEESEVIGSWKPDEQVKSSTWRELEAVYRMLMSKLTYLKGQKVLWRTDNQNVVHILCKGSVKSDLQTIAINIADICTREKIQLSPQWIPRTDNVKADLFRIQLGQTIEDEILAAGVTSDNFSTLADRMFGIVNTDEYMVYEDVNESTNKRKRKIGKPYWNAELQQLLLETNKIDLFSKVQRR